MGFLNKLSSAARGVKFSFGRFSRRSHTLGPVSEERITRYCVGGYHPVRVGDVFNHGRYRIVSKLGYGVYSTVWLALDTE